MAQEGTTFEQTTQQIQDHVGPQIDQFKAVLDEWNQRALRVIKERPGTVLVGAIAAGYLFGRLVSRR